MEAGNMASGRNDVIVVIVYKFRYKASHSNVLDARTRFKMGLHKECRRGHPHASGACGTERVGRTRGHTLVGRSGEGSSGSEWCPIVDPSIGISSSSCMIAGMTYFIG
jgi:hypothetical protein